MSSQKSGPRQATSLIRGKVCHILRDAFKTTESQHLEFFEDGALVIGTKGEVLAVGAARSLLRSFSGLPVVDRRGCLLCPGLVDLHVHWAQAKMIASYGKTLFDWLQQYTFPEELKCRNTGHARKTAQFFFQRLLANGTTTALVFGTHFEEATSIAFEAAQESGLRVILGLSLADRLVPPEMMLAPEEAYLACKRLIERWHGASDGRLGFAVTPRFAPACGPPMMAVCERLKREFTTLHFTTHIHETPDEQDFALSHHPSSSDYLSIYQRYGLIDRRAVLAHSVHTSIGEIEAMASAQCAMAHCPSSNAFLGSGLMPIGTYLDRGVRLGLGSDVGAGTGFSLFKEMGAAYSTQMLLASGRQPTGPQLLYLATLGGAEALGLADKIGNFEPGKEATFVVIDPSQDPEVEARLSNTSTAAEQLFALAIMGSQRLIKETWVAGQCLYRATDGR